MKDRWAPIISLASLVCCAADYSTDPLSTDLDLRVVSPSGSVLVTSASFNNSCEVIDFTAPETGEYKMRVTYYARTPAEGLDLGLGLAWLRIGSRLYLPIVLKDYTP